MSPIDDLEKALKDPNTGPVAKALLCAIGCCGVLSVILLILTLAAGVSSLIGAFR